MQGSTLTVVLWAQASKKYPKWLRASKKKTSTGPIWPVNILVNKCPLKSVPNVFEINEDEIN